MNMINTLKGNTLYLSTKNMVLCAFVSAILCIFAPVSIPLGFTPVPISLALLIVFFSAYVLPPFMAALSVLIYLLLGMAGLPVFSGYQSGVERLIGPTGGYLIGYIPAVLISSFLIHRYKDKRFLHLFGLVSALFSCYLLGSLWFSFQQNIPFSETLKLCVLPFLPGDGIKILIAFFIGHQAVQRIEKEFGCKENSGS